MQEERSALEHMEARLVGAVMVLDAARRLHRKITLWSPANDYEISFETYEDAKDFGDDAEPKPFYLCAECSRMEEGVADNTDLLGYGASNWPCKTIVTLGDPS